MYTGMVLIITESSVTQSIFSLSTKKLLSYINITSKQTDNTWLVMEYSGTGSECKIVAAKPIWRGRKVCFISETWHSNPGIVTMDITTGPRQSKLRDLTVIPNNYHIVLRLPTKHPRAHENLSRHSICVRHKSSQKHFWLKGLKYPKSNLKHEDGGSKLEKGEWLHRWSCLLERIQNHISNGGITGNDNNDFLLHESELKAII